MSLRVPVALKHLVIAAEKHYCLPKGTIRSRVRSGRAAVARQMVYFIAKKALGMSFSKIGKGLGRDHTSVLYGVGKMTEQLENEKQLQEDYRIIFDQAQELTKREAELLGKPISDWLEPTPEIPERQPEPIPEPSIDAEQTAPKSIVVKREDIYPPRAWWEENNERFLAAMRKAHPDREKKLEVPHV